MPKSQERIMAHWGWALGVDLRVTAVQKHDPTWG